MLRNTILLIFCLTLSLNSSFAQKKGGYTITNKKAIKSFEDGILFYRSGKYDLAEEYINKALKEEPNFIEAYLLQGDLYSDWKKYKQASEAYKKAIEIDPAFFPRINYVVGNLERVDGNFKEAAKYYDTFIKNAKKDDEMLEEVGKALKEVKYAIYLIDNPVPFDPKNLGPNVNTADAEYHPSLTADEQVLVITRLEPSGPGACPTPNGKTEDFYFSNKTDKGWSTMKNMGAPLNSKCNEGAQCISPDGRYMFFTACNRPDGLGSCDLYWAENIGGSWTQPRNMGSPINTASWESQPSFSSDGKTLYFISNRKGGFGRSDIYKTELKENGTWSNPVNMGAGINTERDENSPFIHPDDQTLYFASNGHPGIGGFDIFYARKDKKGKFGAPINIGYPINTHNDERSLVINSAGTRAYFASNTLEGYGDFDIFVFDLYEKARPTPVTYMQGIVSAFDSKRPLEAKFELIDLETGDVIASAYSDRMNGDFLVCIPTDRNYALNVSKEGYLFYSENFSLKGIFTADQPFRKNVELRQIKEGEIVILNNIFFDTNSKDLKKESKAELDKLVKLLTNTPSLKIEVSGHTDNVGSKAANLVLSKDRAQSVVNYLIENGIRKDRLTAKGYADSAPVASNETEEGRSLNRRTEFKVLGL
jgi:outer membrane protein OmpA-like peptidoglycan-associated protein